jgi:hypothetical protein
VEDYLVPGGAIFLSDVPGTTAVDETILKAETREPLPASRVAPKKAATKQ